MSDEIGTWAGAGGKMFTEETVDNADFALVLVVMSLYIAAQGRDGVDFEEVRLVLQDKKFHEIVNIAMGCIDSLFKGSNHVS